MFVKITKETWEKCGIKTNCCNNKEKGMPELWLKMSDIEAKLGYSNITDAALKRIRRYCSNKTKTLEKKQVYKTSFEGKKELSLLKNLLVM